MVVQQYVGSITTTKPSIAELNSKLRASIVKPSADSSASSTSSADPQASALALALRNVEGLKTPEGAYPSGTVHLARGGQILDELAVVDKNLGVMDGEAVDLSAYPQLLPLGLKLKSAGPPAGAIEAVVGQNEDTQLDAKDIQIDCSEPTSLTDTKNEDAGDADVEADASATAEGADSSDVTTADAVPIGADVPPPFPVVHSPKPPTARSRLSSLLNWSDAFKAPSEVEASAVHLVVLQHGFLGLSYDMQLIENALRLEMTGSVEVTLTVFKPLCVVNSLSRSVARSLNP